MTDPKTHGEAASMGSHPRLVRVSADASLLDQRPPGRAEGTDALGYQPPNGYWPLVIIAGRFGYLGCEQTQKLEYNGILRSTAWELAKKYFGACPRVINYYDEQGRLIMTE